MLVNAENVCIKLLQALGCDLTAVEHITTRKEMFVLGMEFAFACLMIYFLWKMLYNAMVRFFSPRTWC